MKPQQAIQTTKQQTPASPVFVEAEKLFEQMKEFSLSVARPHVDAPDPHDRRLGPDQFVVSLRHYRPAESELSRERLKAALSTAEGLLLQPRGEGELIELSDDEAVAAAVMLPMVAADRLAPSASSHTGGAFKRNVRGIV